MLRDQSKFDFRTMADDFKKNNEKCTLANGAGGGEGTKGSRFKAYDSAAQETVYFCSLFGSACV